MSGPVPVHTRRLRLEAVDPTRTDDLWQLHQDPGIAAWYGGPWTRDHAAARAATMAESWSADGIGKWIAYDKVTGELVGRGGASRTTIAGTEYVEIGWAVREAFWGQGYATEIGRATLSFVDEVLGVDEVAAYTEIHNRRSRAVMERLGMSFVGEVRATGLVEGKDGVHEDAPFALYSIRGRSAAPS
ncbi:GNAT family N-acetyltransferase [Pseudonocardia xinjiangensis]|uniref:GNAT family N-acetyltransferase n=1 Tax=Pseudonocardia xinjiangensis TaxID=75289 RepID=UPI003D8C1205